MVKHFITPRGEVEVVGNDKYLTVKINSKILHYMFDCLGILRARKLDKNEKQNYDKLIEEFSEIKKKFTS